MISPTVWIVAPFLGLIFGVLLVLSLLWLAFLILTRHWGLTLVMLAVLLMCSGRIWRYCPIHLSDQPAITNEVEQNGEVGTSRVDTIRVLTFNTCAMGRAKVNRMDAPIPVIDMVNESGADIVCLQEYNFSSSKKGQSEEIIRDKLRKNYPYYHLLLNSGSKNMGIVLYSKWPIVYTEKIDKKEKKYCWAFYCELKIHGRKVGLVNCHLRNNSISKSNRKLFHDQVEHFETDSLRRMEEGFRQLGPSFRERTEQVALINCFLRDRAEKRKAEIPMLICGDMNDTPASFAYRVMRGDLDDAWEDAGCGLGISFRDMPFWFRIDHIFHSKHFRTLRAERLDDMKESDHFPVMATFQFLNEEE